MGEIKSAIELAMERTKNLVMDEKERRAFTDKEIEAKARVILRRYTEGMLDERQAARELNDAEGDPRLLRSFLVRMLLDEIDLKSENRRLFELLDLAVGGLPEEGKMAFETLRRAFLERVETARSRVRKSVLERLQGMGISGGSIEPNLETWDEWQVGLSEASTAFEEQVSAWKGLVSEAWV